MKQTYQKRVHPAGRAARTVLAALLIAALGPVMAAEIQGLAWAPSDSGSVLSIRAVGEAAYSTESLENGRYLRLVFADSSLNSAVDKLESNGVVKGVYPYLAQNGTSVYIDLLLEESGRIEVKPAAQGYEVMVTAATDTPSPSAAEAPVAETPVTEAPAPVTETETPAAELNAIEEILYTKLPGDRMQVNLRMSRRPVEPQAFSISSPARIAMDFANTRVAATPRTVAVKEGALTSVTAIEVEGRTRVVLSLVKTVPYTATITDNGYVITLAAPSVATAEKSKTTHFTGSARKSGKYSLKSVDFRRGPLGDAKIIIELSDPGIGVDIREQAGEIVLDFQNTTVPAELQRRLDVVDFATPVQTIDTFVQDKNTRMLITPKGRYEHIAYQTGTVFTVNVKPIIEKPDEKKVDEFGYSGEKLSLNFQNIDVRAALQVLADFTGLNFVVSDTVKGSLTLRLKDVPWDQALDLVIDSKNLAVRRKGNVVTVAPAAEVAAKEKAAAEASKSIIELEPLVSELIQINYAKAEDVAALLKSIKAITTSAGQHPVFGQGVAITKESTDSNTLLSPRGQVTVDVRTNSLLIQDTPGKVREVRKLIAQIDQPVRQVLIESRLVEATDNFARGLGVRWGHLSDGRSGSSRIVTNGNLASVDTYVNAGTYSLPAGLNVNLPSAGVGGKSAGVFAVTLFAGSKILDLELSALEQEGQGKLISSPRIITANQKKAVIEQGQEQVFTTSVLGVGTVVTKKATLKLEVTPQITPDDRVNLEVNITKDNFLNAEKGTLNVKQINTQVLLDNGETVVIGGIFEQDKNDTVTKVPFFGDLPLLGWLFKTKDVKDNKTELLIFLTPKIVAEKLTLR